VNEGLVNLTRMVNEASTEAHELVFIFIKCYTCCDLGICHLEWPPFGFASIFARDSACCFYNYLKLFLSSEVGLGAPFSSFLLYALCNAILTRDQPSVCKLILSGLSEFAKCVQLVKKMK